MTQIIATFKLKDDFEESNGLFLPIGMDSKEINTTLIEIGDRNEMELVSWGTI